MHRDPDNPSITAWRLGFLAAAHIVIGLMINAVSSVAFLHATVVVGSMILVAWTGRVDRFLVVAGYIASSEVLWRMAMSHVPWELAKYSCILGAALLLIRGRHGRLTIAMPLLYAVALVPSVLMPLIDPVVSTARAVETGRFYLAPAFALASVAIVASGATITRQRWDQILMALLLPCLAITAISAVTTLTASDLAFSQESNLTTSGGFGPNQVSTTLGLGTLSSILLFFVGTVPRTVRIGALVIGLILGGATAMTFSRGGFYGAAGASIVAGGVLLWEPSTRKRIMLGAITLLLIGGGLILPKLESFTNGMLGARFSEVQVTHRDVLIRDDIRMFLANPVLGVGPGRSRANRVLTTGIGHTEFTRMLAEHGTPGAISLLALIVLSIQMIRYRVNAIDVAIVAALITWSYLTMFHAAMRLAAPGIVLGIAAARTMRNHRPPDDSENEYYQTSRPMRVHSSTMPATESFSHG